MWPSASLRLRGNYGLKAPIKTAAELIEALHDLERLYALTRRTLDEQIAEIDERLAVIRKILERNEKRRP